MNAEDKKRFERIKRGEGSHQSLPWNYWHEHAKWLCSKVEEFEAEVARLNDALKLTDTYSEGLEAQLAKVKGQRDRLREVLISLLDDTRDPVFDKAKKALAELEKET